MIYHKIIIEQELEYINIKNKIEMKTKTLKKDISKKTNKLIKKGKKISNDTLSGAKEKAKSTIKSASDLLNKGIDKISRKSATLKNPGPATPGHSTSLSQASKSMIR
ncbi:MAG TPA: hypothetical protein VIL99_14325 [Ignavibacteria bacterium]